MQLQRMCEMEEQVMNSFLAKTTLGIRHLLTRRLTTVFVGLRIVRNDDTKIFTLAPQ
jgi:hypothetical protein